MINTITLQIADWHNPNPEIARAGIESFLYFTGSWVIGKVSITLYMVEGKYLYYVASKPKRDKYTVRLAPLSQYDVERLDRKFNQEGRFIRETRQAFMKPITNLTPESVDLSNLTELECLVRTDGFFTMSINVPEHYKIQRVRWTSHKRYEIDLIAKVADSPMGRLKIETDVEWNIIEGRTWLDPIGWLTQKEFRFYLTTHKRKSIAAYHNQE